MSKLNSSIASTMQEDEEAFFNPFWITGEWRSLRVVECTRIYTRLRRCKGYFLPELNCRINTAFDPIKKGENKKGEKSKMKARPILEDWAILEKNGTRYLTNWNKSNKDMQGPGDILYEVMDASIESIQCNIEEGSLYNWKKYQRNAPNGRCRGERIPLQEMWSYRYDNKPVVLLLMEKPKMSFKEICEIITAEGGSVDEQGIVHRKLD